MDSYSDNEVRFVNGLSILAGIWLVVAPFVIHYASTGNQWQEVVFGAAIIVVSLVRLAMPKITWPSWINLLIGAWLIIAPWTIPNTSIAAKWNEVILGIIVA